MNILRNRKQRHTATAGLAVSRTGTGQYLLGTPGDPDSVEVYNDVIDAWKALDEIDSVEVEASHKIAAA